MGATPKAIEREISRLDVEIDASRESIIPHACTEPLDHLKTCGHTPETCPALLVVRIHANPFRF
jgi:hypothetical protein